MYSTSEVRSSFIQDTKGTSEFRSFLEESFASIDELTRKSIKVTPVGPIGLGRVKDQLDLDCVQEVA